MLSDDLRRFAAAGYGFDGDTLRFIANGREASRRFYAFEKGGSEYVLRVAGGCAAEIGQTKAEMDWMRYLAGRGISVAAPLRTETGALATLYEEKGEARILSACDRAKGKPWDKNDPGLWNERVFWRWGNVMGQLHRVTKDYVPLDGLPRRPQFRSIIRDTVSAFPSVRRAAEAVMDETLALPRDRDAYGLIHYDLNPSNFRIDGERINVFDFADCAYAWYALDIGCALAVGLWLGRRNDAGYDFTGDMIRCFLSGYRAANALDAFWLSKIPLFMRMCQIAAFSHTYDRENPADDQQREQLYNIENNIFLTGCAIDAALFS